ncbi:MAG: SDR family NAD(P)-dependent oxidoreductase [Gammaproteobacteria bacterium]
MKLDELKGHWALVTGASSGIGREYCLQLAKAGVNTVLVARRKERLDELRAQIEGAFGARALVVPADLGRSGEAARIHGVLQEKSIRIRLLCNAAAFGQWGRFEGADADLYTAMVQVNTSALVSLCRVFMEDLAGYSSSAIINVSSPAAYQPVPYMAVYAATKAFVHSFSQALHGEWKSRGVLVQTLVPGPTATEFDTKAGAYESALKGRQPASTVVRRSLRELEHGSPVASSATGSFKQRLFAALAPPAMVIRTVGKMFAPPDGGAEG